MRCDTSGVAVYGPQFDSRLCGLVAQVQCCRVLPGSREPAHLSVRTASPRRRAAVRRARLRPLHRPHQLQVSAHFTSNTLQVSESRGPRAPTHPGSLVSSSRRHKVKLTPGSQKKGKGNHRRKISPPLRAQAFKILTASLPPPPHSCTYRSAELHESKRDFSQREGPVPQREGELADATVEMRLPFCHVQPVLNCSVIQ